MTRDISSLFVSGFQAVHKVGGWKMGFAENQEAGLFKPGTH
jgi:hypothetical protein